jgi:CubicO group peptidase (beta-lactamase class C family)
MVRGGPLFLLCLSVQAAGVASAGEAPGSDLPTAVAEAEGFDSQKLLELARWVQDSKLPIYSVLVSHGGKLVFELYTGHIQRDDAHYVMSVTKSVLSAGIGAAIDRGLIGDPDTTSIVRLLPAGLFKDPSQRGRFDPITLKHVMGMSVLDAKTGPHDPSPAGQARLHAFWTAKSRLAFALAQPFIDQPGVAFQYNDVTPLIATGILIRATGKSAFDFLREALFEPMGFRNEEWMHVDPSGIDNGGYGLRLRPIDMQKLGILYLRKGRWGERQLLSARWVERSFSPWIKNHDGPGEPNYGWFWWTCWFPSGWKCLSAGGWKGQRIWIFPQQDVVVTTTAYLDRDEPEVERMLKDFVIPAFESARGKKLAPSARTLEDLAAVLADLQREPLRHPPHPESRMLPSARKKEKRPRSIPPLTTMP